MKNVFIPTANVTAFREAAMVVSDTEKGQPGMMVSWGRAGLGKTKCSMEWAVNTPGALFVRVYEDWTAKAMLSRICFELNGMRPGQVEKAKRVLIEELDKPGKVLIVDEADRLSIKNIEHLRDIHDETGTPIILVGEPSLYAQLTARRRIWERVTRVVEFEPVTDEDVIHFGIEGCDLDIAPNAAQTLASRSKGSFRLLYHMMVDLDRLARANETTAVTLDMVNNLPDQRKAPSQMRKGR